MMMSYAYNTGCNVTKTKPTADTTAQLNRAAVEYVRRFNTRGHKINQVYSTVVRSSSTAPFTLHKILRETHTHRM